MSKTVAAGIFIIRKDGKLLICHPTNHPETVWSITKGKLDADETALEAALRETQEESNIELSDKSECFNIYLLTPITYKHKKKILHPYLFWEKSDSKIDWASIEIKCNSKVQPDRGDFYEMDKFLWTSLEEAKILLHYTQVTALIEIEEIISEEKTFC